MANPEAMLDVLSMETFRQRFGPSSSNGDSFYDNGILFPEESDQLESFVRDLCIDDSISCCFADPETDVKDDLATKVWLPFVKKDKPISGSFPKPISESEAVNGHRLSYAGSDSALSWFPPTNAGTMCEYTKHPEVKNSVVGNYRETNSETVESALSKKASSSLYSEIFFKSRNSQKASDSNHRHVNPRSQDHATPVVYQYPEAEMSYISALPVESISGGSCRVNTKVETDTESKRNLRGNNDLNNYPPISSAPILSSSFYGQNEEIQHRKKSVFQRNTLKSRFWKKKINKVNQQSDPIQSSKSIESKDQQSDKIQSSKSIESKDQQSDKIQSSKSIESKDQQSDKIQSSKSIESKDQQSDPIQSSKAIESKLAYTKPLASGSDVSFIETSSSDIVATTWVIDEHVTDQVDGSNPYYSFDLNLEREKCYQISGDEMCYFVEDEIYGKRIVTSVNDSIQANIEIESYRLPVITTANDNHGITAYGKLGKFDQSINQTTNNNNTFSTDTPISGLKYCMQTGNTQCNTSNVIHRPIVCYSVSDDDGVGGHDSLQDSSIDPNLNADKTANNNDVKRSKPWYETEPADCQVSLPNDQLTHENLTLRALIEKSARVLTPEPDASSDDQTEDYNLASKNTTTVLKQQFIDSSDGETLSALEKSVDDLLFSGSDKLFERSSTGKITLSDDKYHNGGSPQDWSMRSCMDIQDGNNTYANVPPRAIHSSSSNSSSRSDAPSASPRRETVSTSSVPSCSNWDAGRKLNNVCVTSELENSVHTMVMHCQSMQELNSLLNEYISNDERDHLRQCVLKDILLKDDVSSWDKDTATSPLHLATRLGRLECLRILLESQPLLEWYGWSDDLALELATMAVETNQVKCLLLLHHMSSIPALTGTIDPEGNTLMHLAASLNHTDITVALISLGHDASIENRARVTSLQLCLQHSVVSTADNKVGISSSTLKPPMKIHSDVEQAAFNKKIGNRQNTTISNSNNENQFVHQDNSNIQICNDKMDTRLQTNSEIRNVDTRIQTNCDMRNVDELLSPCNSKSLHAAGQRSTLVHDTNDDVEPNDGQAYIQSVINLTDKQENACQQDELSPLPIGVIETPPLVIGAMETPPLAIGAIETPPLTNAVTGTPPLTNAVTGTPPLAIGVSETPSLAGATGTEHNLHSIDVCMDTVLVHSSDDHPDKKNNPDTELLITNVLLRELLQCMSKDPHVKDRDLMNELCHGLSDTIHPDADIRQRVISYIKSHNESRKQMYPNGKGKDNMRLLSQGLSAFSKPGNGREEKVLSGSSISSDSLKSLPSSSTERERYTRHGCATKEQDNERDKCQQRTNEYPRSAILETLEYRNIDNFCISSDELYNSPPDKVPSSPSKPHHVSHSRINFDFKNTYSLRQIPVDQRNKETDGASPNHRHNNELTLLETETERRNASWKVKQDSEMISRFVLTTSRNTGQFSCEDGQENYLNQSEAEVVHRRQVRRRRWGGLSLLPHHLKKKIERLSQKGKKKLATSGTSGSSNSSSSIITTSSSSGGGGGCRRGYFNAEVDSSIRASVDLGLDYQDRSSCHNWNRQQEENRYKPMHNRPTGKASLSLNSDRFHNVMRHDDNNIIAKTDQSKRQLGLANQISGNGHQTENAESILFWGSMDCISSMTTVSETEESDIRNSISDFSTNNDMDSVSGFYNLNHTRSHRHHHYHHNMYRQKHHHHHHHQRSNEPNEHDRYYHRLRRHYRELHGNGSSPSRRRRNRCLDVEADECGDDNTCDNENDGDEDSDSSDDEPRVRVPVSNEEWPDEMLREQRLTKHLESIQRLQSGNFQVIESVIAGTGELLTSQGDGSREPSHVNIGEAYPFRPHNENENQTALRSKRSRATSPSTQIRSSRRPKIFLFNHEKVQPDGAKETDKKEGVNAMAGNSKAYTRDEDRIQRCDMDNDVPWNMLSFSDSDDTEIKEINFR